MYNLHLVSQDLLGRGDITAVNRETRSIRSSISCNLLAAGLYRLSNDMQSPDLLYRHAGMATTKGTYSGLRAVPCACAITGRL